MSTIQGAQKRVEVSGGVLLRVVLFACVGVVVLALGGSFVAIPRLQTELYWTGGYSVVGTTTDGVLLAVSYALHNDTDTDRLYIIEGFVEGVQGTTTRVFVREEYLPADDVRVLEEIFVMVSAPEAGTTLHVTLRDPHQSIYTRIPTPP